MITNENVSSRIVEYLGAKKISRSEVAKMIGMKSATLISQLNGTNGLDLEVLGKIFTIFPDLNKDWVFTGAGEMEFAPGSNNAPLSHAQARIAELEETISKMEQTLREKDAQIEVLKSVIKGN